MTPRETLELLMSDTHPEDTLWRDPDGDVQFRADIYRRDVKLYSALFGNPYPY